MARYADGLIAEGEHILVRTRQHWFSIVAYTVAFWVMVAIAVGFFILKQIIDWDPLAWIALISLVGAIVWIVWRYASWSFQDYIITNRRVMQVEGIVNKVSKDSSLEKINDAVLRQGLFDDFKMLNEAAQFKKTMLNAKYALEREVAAPMPGPPLRAPSGGSGEGASTEAAAASAGSGPATPDAVAGSDVPEAMSPEEVTDTLHRLADLRDRGAISAAEYDAKKAELLERI